MTDKASKVRHRGMTAIEVLASTILSAMLMAALIGILRGLKAHEQTLESRRPEPVWQASLEASLAADLQHAATYQLTPQALTLFGHGGRDESGRPSWLPSTITYELRGSDQATGVVRRVVSGSAPGVENIALLGPTSIRAAPSVIPSDEAPVVAEPIEMNTRAPTITTKVSPLPDDLTIEFWGTSRDPLFSYRYRRL